MFCESGILCYALTHFGGIKMERLKLKRTCQTITCDVCSSVFKQIRPWQVYCSTACRVVAWHAKRGKCVNESLDTQAEMAELRHEVARLKAILDDAGIPY